MKILVTNDDGYNYKGLQVLVEMLRPWGDLVVIGPKYHQSGMSMAVSMGMKPIAVKKLREEPGAEWWYLDATPSSCVKWALDEVYTDGLPDLIVSGINHGANTASAALYSGTLGAAQEGALAGVLSVGVSLDSFDRDADFSVVREHFLSILKGIMDNRSEKFGIYYNVNFPNLPLELIKGVKFARQGTQHWIKEFRPYDYGFFERNGLKPSDLGVAGFPEVEEGEKVYMMVGDLVGDPRNDAFCDNILLEQGYVTITVHNIDSTDYQELSRLSQCGITL